MLKTCKCSAHAALCRLKYRSAISLQQLQWGQMASQQFFPVSKYTNLQRGIVYIETIFLYCIKKYWRRFQPKLWNLFAELPFVPVEPISEFRVEGFGIPLCLGTKLRDGLKIETQEKDSATWPVTGHRDGRDVPTTAPWRFRSFMGREIFQCFFLICGFFS